MSFIYIFELKLFKLIKSDNYSKTHDFIKIMLCIHFINKDKANIYMSQNNYLRQTKPMQKENLKRSEI